MQSKIKKLQKTRRKYPPSKIYLMSKLTKESLIEVIKNTQFDDKTLEDFYRMVKTNPTNIKDLSKHLELLEFKDHEELSRLICLSDHGDSVKNIIGKTIVESDFPQQKHFSLIALCRLKGINLSPEVLDLLLNHKSPDAKTYVGKGETLMRILMKGTPVNKGDLGANGKRFEIKFNNARLRGVTGYDATDASQVSIALDEMFIHECRSLGFDVKSLIGTEEGRWNFVSDRNARPYLLSEIVAKTGMDPIQACKIFVNAFAKYFTSMTELEALKLARSLSKEFMSTGIKERIDGRIQRYSDFIYKMCAYSMKYYAKVEDFNGMIILNDQFDCMYITREFIDDSNLDTLSEFIRLNLCITTPSLTTKAGTQGSAFGISIKSVK